MSEGNIRVSGALMAQLEQAVTAEERSPDEVVADAVERYLRLKRRETLYAYGEGQAQKLGIREEDVPALVKDVRTTERGR